MGSRHPLTALQAAQAARLALAEQRETEWLGPVRDTAEQHRTDPMLWQWTALLHRALDDRANAIAAYERAAALAPCDAKIAHGLARTRWEAGMPSLGHYRRASDLAPFDGDVLLGTAAARFAAGDRAGALAGIETILKQEPRWIDGQRQAAQLRFLAGEREFVAGIERALADHPRDEHLWQLLLTLNLQANENDAAAASAHRAVQAIGDRRFIAATRAIVASNTGAVAEADADFATLAPLGDASVAVHHIRHLLRTARIEQAGQVLSPWLDRADASAFQPYAALIWRLTDDPRFDWLERDDTLVRTFDLRAALPPLDRLAAKLRALHHGAGAPLDQSVRGGSQTDGLLLANLDDDIVQTRQAILGAVRAYLKTMPPIDWRHSTLGHRRDGAPRFAGSWSVRLRGGGRHDNHVHPAGWISSALYVALPVEGLAGDEVEAGSLTLGEPPSDLLLSLSPRRTIKPVPGMLVLFPSTMWHGTRPFADGERLTIAFDIAPPAAR